MHITSKLLGILPLILTSLFMSCGQLTFKGDITKSDEPEEEQLKEGYGSMHLSLAKDSFPEGAETLRLYIIPKSDIDCHWIEPFMGGDELAGAGAGLNLAKPVYVPDDCKPPLPYKNGSEEMDEEAGFPAAVEPSLNSIVITLNRGEQIKPIMLRTGSYKVSADFSDESGQLLYYGSEYVSIFDGEKRSVTILLKKIESGKLTVGFEVEQPEVLPTKISQDALVAIHRQPVKGIITTGEKNRGYNIQVDLLTGQFTLSTDCGRSLELCAALVRQGTASKSSLLAVRSILSGVKLQKIEGLCQDPLEIIKLSVLRCEECVKGKVFDFTNAGCGQPSHNLSGEQVNKIWAILSEAKVTK